MTVDRLGDVIVAAALIAGFDVLFLASSGDQDDRNLFK